MFPVARLCSTGIEKVYIPSRGTMIDDDVQKHR